MLFFFSLQNASVFSAGVQRVKEIGFSALTFFSLLSFFSRGEKSVEVNFRKQLTSTARADNSLKIGCSSNSATVEAIPKLCTFWHFCCLSNLHAFALCRGRCTVDAFFVYWAFELHVDQKPTTFRFSAITTSTFCRNDGLKIFACFIVVESRLIKIPFARCTFLNWIYQITNNDKSVIYSLRSSVKTTRLFPMNVKNSALFKLLKGSKAK